jgi:hypothetical protein
MILFPIQHKNGLYYLTIASNDKKIIDEMHNMIASQKDSYLEGDEQHDDNN